MKHKSPTQKYNQLVNLNLEGEEPSESEMKHNLNNSYEYTQTSHYKDKVEISDVESRAQHCSISD